MAQRVLLITYQFPPVGGAGVQRVTKFTKYLPKFDWQASVLTVANPSVPVADTSLLVDVPVDTVIRRARTLEPGYAIKAAVSAGESRSERGSARPGQVVRGMARRVAGLALQPDPQILWVRAAIREGMRLLREEPHSAIVASAPPFSTFLVGEALARRTGLPLVLDYRDEWCISNDYFENRRPDPVSRWVQMRMQRRVVRRAKALVATTQASARCLEQVVREAGSAARVECIYNGYDPADFQATPSIRGDDSGLFRLAYVGTLWALTSVAPLVAAVIELARREPELTGRLELVFAGRRTGPQQELLGHLTGLPCRVVEFPYLDHTGAVELMHSASGLCVLLTETPGADRVVPAKIFEYMAARRPILAVAPRGELWDLLTNYPEATAREPTDVAGIAAWLEREVRRHQDGTVPDLQGWDGLGFDRRSQSKQLADILRSLV